MSSLVISGDTSGTVTVAAPAVAGSNTLTLLAATATNSVNTLATAVASTSGTSIDFTSLPSWIKRITVMFNAVSTSGTSNIQIQLGTGSTTFTTSGYAGAGMNTNSGTLGTQNYTSGLATSVANAAAGILVGHAIFTNVSGNIWVGSINCSRTDIASVGIGSTVITLPAVLTAVRITTVNGTDTFDAGSVNILYEG